MKIISNLRRKLSSIFFRNLHFQTTKPFSDSFRNMSTGNLNGSGYTTGLWEDCRIGRSNESNLPLSSKDNIVSEQDQLENNVRCRQINVRKRTKTQPQLCAKWPWRCQNNLKTGRFCDNHGKHSSVSRYHCTLFTWFRWLYRHLA